jgi:carboxyl-terminal processing protease
MKVRRSGRALSLMLASLVVLSACDPFDQASLPETLGGPGSQTQSAAVDPIQQGGDTLVRALTLLRDNYPEGAETGRLVAAGQRGAWYALAQAGIAPQDVDLPPADASPADTPPQLRLRYRQIARSYGSKVDPQWLSHEMIRRMAESFGDCHTGFLSPQQVRDHVNRLQGTTRFGGVGVILRRDAETGSFAVIEVFDGGPAAKAGVRRGDLIVSVDGEALQGLGLEEVVAMVRGQEGAPVRLGVNRAGTPREFDVTRGQVSAPFIRSGLLTGNVGYLHLYSFPEPLVGQLDQALKEFERRDVVGVVLDLRDNSGGQLDVVTRVASRFVKSGMLFRTVVPGGDRTVYQADGSYWRAAKPIAVVVNSGTGSGGEIVASAIQEHGAGWIIGTRSSGCVSTGQMFPLPDGSALEIATSRVLTGLQGAELNKVGVEPDATVHLRVEDLANDRDPQLERAAELLLSR